MAQLVISSDVQRKLQEHTKEREIKDKYHQEVVALAGSQAKKVKSQFLKTLEERNIPSTSVDHFTILEHDFIVVKKIFKEREEAATAIRIEPYGNDLIVETRQYEWSKTARQNQMFWGIFLTVVGLPFFWTGIGSLAAIIGIYLIFAHPQLGGAKAEEVQAFRTAIRETLSSAQAKIKIKEAA